VAAWPIVPLNPKNVVKLGWIPREVKASPSSHEFGGSQTGIPVGMGF
jgi:hypothetical protein